jgi:TPR repeat protein
MHTLGISYKYGSTVPRDPVEAFGWFEKSALLGDADSQREVGLAYLRGDGVTKDPASAFVWLVVPDVPIEQLAARRRRILGRPVLP